MWTYQLFTRPRQNGVIAQQGNEIDGLKCDIVEERRDRACKEIALGVQDVNANSLLENNSIVGVRDSHRSPDRCEKQDTIWHICFTMTTHQIQLFIRKPHLYAYLRIQIV